MTRAHRALVVGALIGGCAGSPGGAPPQAPRQVTAGAVAAPPESLRAVGESIYFHGEYDKARALWLGALARARAVGDSAAQGRLLTWLGLVAWRQGDYAAARRLGEEALALKLRLNFTQDLFKSYNALGLLAWNEARLGDAVQLFGKAAAAARAASDTKGLASVSGNLALVETELGDFDAARAGFHAAREGAQRVGDARLEGNALTNLGMLDIHAGDPQAAISFLEAARERYRTVHYATGEQNALGQLGTAYDALGEPHLAFAALDSALAEARAQGLRQAEASDLEALAQLFQEAGDARRALDFYASAGQINRDLHLDEETGADLRNEAAIRASLGDLDQAQRDVVAARLIHRRVGARVEVLGDLLLLADVLDRRARHAESRSVLAAARGLANGLAARPVRVDVALAAARIADRAGDAPDVLQALASVRTDLARGGYDTEWEAAALRGRAYRRLGRLALAAAAGREAVGAVERVRGNFGSGLLRTDYLADRAAVYADLVGVLARLGRWDEAFEVSDAARGRALLERSTVGPEGAGANGETLLRRVDRLAFMADSVERELGPHPDSGARAIAAGISQRLREARRAYEALAVRAAEQRTPAATLLGRSPARAAEVRASLGLGEVLLEYLIGSDRVMIFVVTADSVRMAESRVAVENLASRVRLARDGLSSGGSASDANDRVLSGLYDVLIAPAERTGALRRARSLIIVPQGVLSYLPFAALRAASRGYLIQDYAVSYLASAAALPAFRSHSVQAVASKAFGPVGAAVFAPDPEGLRATRGEALAVAHALTGARLLVGRSATEARLREALATVSVVHVAGHGIMNATNPLFSRIELARGEGGAGDDGGLEVHELLDLSVASRLIFLSGCETGLGTAWSSVFARGEDYTTLAQAFLYAGARTVIATLWRVEDDGAAVFAERFYAHLRNLPPVEALAATQQEMLNDPRYRAPYHWAAYRLSGAGDGVFGASGPLTVSVRSSRSLEAP